MPSGNFSQLFGIGATPSWSQPGCFGMNTEELALPLGCRPRDLSSRKQKPCWQILPDLSDFVVAPTPLWLQTSRIPKAGVPPKEPDLHSCWSQISSVITYLLSRRAGESLTFCWLQYPVLWSTLGLSSPTAVTKLLKRHNDSRAPISLLNPNLPNSILIDHTLSLNVLNRVYDTELTSRVFRLLPRPIPSGAPLPLWWPFL